jgi:hypothetical protein
MVGRTQKSNSFGRADLQETGQSGKDNFTRQWPNSPEREQIDGGIANN